MELENVRNQLIRQGTLVYAYDIDNTADLPHCCNIYKCQARKMLMVSKVNKGQAGVSGNFHSGILADLR